MTPTAWWVPACPPRSWLTSATPEDCEGFFPFRPIATGETFAPGSTMKVVTSTAAYNLKPSLAGFNYPVASVPEVR